MAHLIHTSQCLLVIQQSSDFETLRSIEIKSLISASSMASVRAEQECCADEPLPVEVSLLDLTPILLGFHPSAVTTSTSVAKKSDSVNWGAVVRLLAHYSG